MITTILLLLTIILTVGIGISKRKTLLGSSGLITKLVLFLISGILISIFQPYTAERVDAGNIGIKANLTGSERGVSDATYVTGWIVYNTWTTQVYEYPIFQQHVEYDDQMVILKGGFPTNITPTFNYKLKQESVVDMFKELRLSITEIQEGWLKTAIVTSVNDVSNRWEVDAIFNNREKFEAEIVADCNKRIGAWFNISQLRTNIKPPQSLIKQIEAKTNAIQEEQAKLTEVAVVRAEGEKMIAQAKADSAQAVINASGQARAILIKAAAEAESIRIKQKEVSAIYNEYIRSQKWDGVYPTTIAGTNTSILLDNR